MLISGEVPLQANPKQVWNYVTEPEHFPDWVASWSGWGGTGGANQGAPVVASSPGLETGSELAWKAKLGPIGVSSRERVVAAREPEHMAFEGELAGVPFRSSMSLRERRPEGTTLRVDIEYAAPVSRGGSLTNAAIRPIVRAALVESLGRVGERLGALGPATTDLALSRSEVVALYENRAPRYDSAIRLYEAAGFQTDRYRERAANALALRKGATVVEIGCGTGLNLPLLRERVGPEGRVIGVDVTESMLDRALQRVRDRGWTNVELVCSDAARYQFPERVEGIVSTLALTLSEDYDAIIESGAAALASGGRWVILDLKYPTGWPSWMVRAALLTMRPYGVVLGAADRRPWESLRKYLSHTSVEDLYLGAAYLAWGEK